MLDAPRKRNVQNVKILATSDLHGKLKRFKKAVLREKPEIVIIAGDITDRSGDDRARAVRTWRALGDFCASDDAKGIDFVVVPGNHDEGSRRIAKELFRQTDNIHYLDRHRSNHREHFEKKPDRFLKMNVSTWVERGYGYYLVDYTRGGAITADWKDGR